MHQDSLGRVEVKNYADGDYALTLRVNHDPYIQGNILPLRAASNQALQHTFAENLFIDPDGDSLSYRMEGLPTGLSFDAATRTLSGTPHQTGDYTLTLIADDGKGGIVRPEYAAQYFPRQSRARATSASRNANINFARAMAMDNAAWCDSRPWWRYTQLSFG